MQIRFWKPLVLLLIFCGTLQGETKLGIGQHFVEIGGQRFEFVVSSDGVVITELEFITIGGETDNDDGDVEVDPTDPELVKLRETARAALADITTDPDKEKTKAALRVVYESIGGLKGGNDVKQVSIPIIYRQTMQGIGKAVLWKRWDSVNEALKAYGGDLDVALKVLVEELE